ncbi:MULTISPECIES: peroxiredoxin [unclassified Iodidimonas]|jgi:peroxiredoxin (alkyl hydroperoxide reductase subunit C)|uniref:peroxiredoxin n=1 Tax=unclassified Iodidimonas TaxID=2626145 RepID=UPI0024827929|nr:MULTISPECIES: peroxiredoxin [unclassified Iodidimonas]
MTDTQNPDLNRAVRIGDPAPDFVARSTKGEVKLSSYRGRWLIFFSHPADFTPVCTTEFIGLAKRQPAFDELDCALLGLSVDSLYAHFAWVRAIEEQFDITIDFPIIEDPSMAIGFAYGMIDHTSADSMAVRSAYFIDPEGIVRAVTTYPHDVGRSVDEMLRLMTALKAVDDGKGFAPEGWQPGTALLAPPPDGRGPLDEGADWFCKTRP